MSAKETARSTEKPVPSSNMEQRKLREALVELENELPGKLQRFSGITSLIVSSNLYEKLIHRGKLTKRDNCYILEIPDRDGVPSTRKVFVLKDPELPSVKYYYSPYTPQELVVLVNSLHHNGVKKIPFGPLVGVLFVSDRIKGLIIVNDTVNVLFERAELIAALLQASMEEFLATSPISSDLAEVKSSDEVIVAEPEVTIESIFLRKLAEVRKNRQ